MLLYHPNITVLSKETNAAMLMRAATERLLPPEALDPASGNPVVDDGADGRNEQSEEPRA